MAEKTRTNTLLFTSTYRRFNDNWPWGFTGLCR